MGRVQGERQPRRGHPNRPRGHLSPLRASQAYDYARIYESMQKPAFIFDGRNILDHESLQGLGYEVWAVGKSLEKLDAQ